MAKMPRPRVGPPWTSSSVLALAEVLLACCALMVIVPTAQAAISNDTKCQFMNIQCPEKLMYRPIDGSCNNLIRPWMGRANSPTLRLIPPAYGNAAGAPRRSQTGSPLPSAQEIVTRLMPEVDHPSYHTHLFILWAQIISHDFALRAAPKNSVYGPCCGKDAGDNCFSIPVPKSDPFYQQHNLECLPMGRTNSVQCTSNQPEQLSGSTHFLDASFVYGSSEATMTRLRQFEGGLLRARLADDGANETAEFPPNVPDTTATCGRNASSGPCYDCGDPRTNQSPMLAAIQVVWLREHNRVARLLSAINPQWNDEKVFQEARRVVVAEWQIVTFREWLPWLLGRERIRELGIMPEGPTPAAEYTPSVDPRTANDVTTSVFRSLHSMVQGKFWLGDRGQRSEVFSAWLLNPGPLLEAEDGMLHVLQGLSYQQAQDQDRWMDTQLTQQYEPVRTADGKQFGHNLVAVDIQRGRDHGLPGYTAYRKYVGLGEAKNFESLLNTISQQDVDVLKEIYDHVDDVDFYVGGVIERRKRGAPLFGPTFQPLLEDQFWRWRFADRFFYNFVGFEHSFTREQIRALERTSVARLFCDNVRGFKIIPRDVFVKTGFAGNEDVSCDELPKVDFSRWAEDHNLNKKDMKTPVWMP